MNLRLIWVLSIACCAVLGQTKNQSETYARLTAKVVEQGGFEAIEKALAPLREEITARIKATGGRGRIKRGMHRFNRNITASAIKSEWKYKPEPEKGQFLPADVVMEFDKQLKAMGIKLIFVPVPSKIEAYPEVFDSSFPKNGIVSPGRTQTMMKLIEGGVEVVDVLPEVLALKDGTDIPVYETSGHHLSGLSVKLVGDVIAKRLMSLQLEGRNPNQFKAVERLGTERVDRSVPMKVWEVRYGDDRPYEHQSNAQIAVIGDSNAFAFRKASWASHIARATGVPVADHSTSSGGSFAHITLAELGLPSMERLTAVVWIVTSTHLERMGWPMGTMPEKATIRGLAAAGRINEAYALFDAYQKEGHTNPPWPESHMNRLGYALFFSFKQEAAVAVFTLNTMAYPKSANAFDSLGEAYKMLDQVDDARETFLKGLALSPSERLRKTLIANLADIGFDEKGETMAKPNQDIPWPHESSALALWAKTFHRGAYAKPKSHEEALFNYDVESKGFAHLDDVGRLQLKHGQFTAPNTENLLTEAFTGDFTFETFAHFANSQTSGTLWQFGSEDSSPHFRLSKWQDTLIFSLRTKQGEVDLLSAKLDANQSQHCTVQRQGQSFSLWVNGQLAASAQETPKKIGSKRPCHLVFGNGTPKKPGLEAALEGVAIHRKALAREMLKALATSYSNAAAKRKQQPMLSLKGRLLRKSHVAEIGEIAPYKRSLSVYEYEVLALRDGDYEPKTIRVAHWTLMDGTHHPHRFLKEGEAVELRLLAYGANRELRNIHLSDTLPIDFDAELFYQTAF